MFAGREEPSGQQHLQQSATPVALQFRRVPRSSLSKTCIGRFQPRRPVSRLQ
jgi:hypothetical protein